MKTFFLFLLLAVCAAGGSSPAMRPGVANQATHQTIVRPMLPNVNTTRILQCVTDLSNIFTRYYDSPGGQQASDYFFSQYSAAAAASKLKSTIKVTRFRHSNMPRQQSIIASIPAKTKGAKGYDEVVMVGGHLDSCAFKNSNGTSEYPMNCWGQTRSQCAIPNFASRRAPGADDNASGSCVALEIFRAIAASGFQGEREMQFVAFAAEEWGVIASGKMQGLAGSTDVANDYNRRGIKLAAFLNYDSVSMTIQQQLALGVPNLLNCPNTDAIGAIVSTYNGYTLANLTDMQQSSAAAYGPTQTVRGPQGYGKSDFASFGALGYSTAAAVGSGIVLSDYFAHSALDVVANINASYAAAMARMGLGFIVEESFYSAPTAAVSPLLEESDIGGAEEPRSGSSLVIAAVIASAVICVVAALAVAYHMRRRLSYVNLERRTLAREML